MTLRNVLVALCVGLIAVTVVGYAAGWPTWTPTGIGAAVVLVLIIFEQTRYRPKVDATSGAWIRTGERFEDPTTGETLDVYANPSTGERDYRKVT